MCALWRAGVAIIALGVCAAGAGTGALAAFLLNAPPIPVMENYDPPEMTVMQDRTGEPVARFFREQRRVVSLREMPSHLPEAFVAIEDTNFAHHVGVSPKGILRAVVANLAKRRAAQGASTITQQLARNLPLGIGREKTVTRKVRETLVALQMERLYTKDQILEVYLNQIYLGSGTYGVGTAASTYFGKPVEDLTRGEIALLAGLPQLPEAYSPLNNSARARERRDMVLDRLHDLGWMTDEQHAEAMAETIRVASRRESSAPEWAGAFVDAARAELSRAAAVDGDGLREEGLHVRTTMHAAAQGLAAEVLAAGLEVEESEWLALRPGRFAEHRNSAAFFVPPIEGQVRMAEVVRVFDNSLVVEFGHNWRADLEIPEGAAHLFTAEAGIAPGAGVDVEVAGVRDEARRLWEGRLLPRKRLQGALVCLDRESGEILALAGGHTWGDRATDGWFNRALRARRQAGSTLKPFFYLSALEAGLGPDSLLRDEPLEIAGYAPRNYDNRYHGLVTMQEALEHSYNVSAVRMARDIGFRRVSERVRAFDILRDTPQWDVPPHASVVLGTTAVTPLELAGAYLTLANGGVAHQPTALRTIVKADGRRLALPASQPLSIAGPEETAALAQMLTGVMTHGSGRTARGFLPPRLQDSVAGKSGTTSDNRDAWFAGWTPDWVVVVWVGFDQPLPLGPGRTGGRTAGTIWGQYVAALAEATGLPAAGEQLPLPAGSRWVLTHRETRRPAPARITTAGGEWIWRAVGPDWRPPAPEPVLARQTAELLPQP